MKKYTIISVVVIIAFVVIFWGGSKSYLTVPTDNATPAGWKTYRNEQYGFELTYPSSSKFQVYPNDNSVLRSTQIFLDIEKKHYVQIDVDDSNYVGSHYCHLMLCDLPSKSVVSHNGTDWDYLGNDSFDTGSAMQIHNMDVFRTKKGVFVYYLMIKPSKQGNGDFLKNIKLY